VGLPLPLYVPVYSLLITESLQKAYTRIVVDWNIRIENYLFNHVASLVRVVSNVRNAESTLSNKVNML
jgi:hypothetical protein